MLLILVKDSHQVFYIESGLKITWILVNLHGAFLLTIKLESREKGIKHLYCRGVSPVMLSLNRNSGEANGINTGSFIGHCFHVFGFCMCAMSNTTSNLRS